MENPQNQQIAWKAAKQRKSKEELKMTNSKTPPTLSMQALPLLIDIYRVSSLNHPISKGSTNFVHILSPIGNELIKHKWEEGDAMHEIKIRLLHKIYKQVFEQLYTIIMPRFAKQGWILIKRQLQDSK
jgi:hypothetical protein